jgi:hypothetical protein
VATEVPAEIYTNPAHNVTYVYTYPAATTSTSSGTYARGWSAWDNDEMARSGGAHNPRTDTFGGGNMYYDFDDKEGWSERFVQRGDQWIHSETDYDGNQGGSTTRDAQGNTRTDFESSNGGQGTTLKNGQGRTTAGRSENGDLYAGHNGDVYRRDQSGDWSSFQNGNWQTNDRSSAGNNRSNLNTGDYDNLNRQHQARQSGSHNYNQYQNHRSGASRSS